MWKWYVLKAVIAALVVFVGYKVFVDKPSPEQLAPTQEELDSLSGDIDIAIILRIRDFFANDKRKATEILATFFIIKATRIVPIADTSNI